MANKDSILLIDADGGVTQITKESHPEGLSDEMKALIEADEMTAVVFDPHTSTFSTMDEDGELTAVDDAPQEGDAEDDSDE